MIGAAQIVDAWEEGAGQHPIDRALTLLRVYAPEMPRAELAGLSIGRRDALLLDFREQAFGPGMNAFADCPACGQHLEFEISVSEIRVSEPDLPPGVHLPDSYDLAAAARAGDMAAARRILAERCGAANESDEAEIARLDPQADVSLQIECATCGHSWPEAFDIASYLWAEIVAAAKRLAREVHQLALAYGWSERDILAMSPARRQLYLEALD